MLQSDGAFGGKPIQERQAINDFRGCIAELLSKAINRGALDQELTVDDRERLIAFLREYGDLSKDSLYKGSERSGYKVFPGAFDQIGVSRDPLSLGDLLKDDALDDIMFSDIIEMQAPMFEPVGEWIGFRLLSQVDKESNSARCGSEPHPSTAGPDARSFIAIAAAVKVTALSADYVVCTIPLPVLARIDTDFSPQVKQAIAGAKYDHAAKVAFESPVFGKRNRFMADCRLAAPPQVWCGIPAAATSPLEA